MAVQEHSSVPFEPYETKTSIIGLMDLSGKRLNSTFDLNMDSQFIPADYETKIQAHDAADMEYGERYTGNVSQSVWKSARLADTQVSLRTEEMSQPVSFPFPSFHF
jgi:hypothetical protein